LDGVRKTLIFRSDLRSFMRSTRRAFLASTVAATALAGCTGGSGDATDEPTGTDGTSTTSPDESTDEPGEPTVRASSHPELGEILVGANGMTLYMFESDTKGAESSTCYDGCASAWPPLTVEETPTAGDGVSAALGTFDRETGETQVTAGGWPLYYYSPDENPGDATGQGVGGVWWVVAPDGTPKKPEATGSTETDSYYSYYPY
jgi:predicted lipoprotein with Yx(FWY)xxD motif